MTSHCVLADVIETAGLGDDDIDIGTSGMCGTFALALKAVFPEVELGLIVLNGGNGKPLRAKDGFYFWRHVVAICEDRLFDVEGEVLLDHVIENYCWGNVRGDGGSLVKVKELDLLAHLADEKGSLDVGHFSRWRATLASTRNSVGGGIVQTH